MDIKLIWDINAYEAIASLLSNDVEMDAGIATAVIVSLFTDARASADDTLPDPNGSRRGWWGDLTSEKANDSVGSKLWLYERSRIDTQLMLNIKQTAQSALKWMIEEGLAKSVVATVEAYTINDNRQTVALKVEITKPDGTKLPYKFEALWEGIA